MGMTPAEFYESFVQGNFNDCEQEPGDIRRAFNAAVAASHFADHYYAYNKRHEPALVSKFPTIRPFIGHLSKATCNAFKDIRSIANAYKHLYEEVERPSAYSTVSSAGSIEVIELPENEDFDRVEQEYVNDTPAAGTRLAVVFTRKDGSRAELLQILQAVIEHFDTMMFGSPPN
jgi:hypothetical protein